MAGKDEQPNIWMGWGSNRELGFLGATFSSRTGERFDEWGFLREKHHAWFHGSHGQAHFKTTQTQRRCLPSLHRPQTSQFPSLNLICLICKMWRWGQSRRTQQDLVSFENGILLSPSFPQIFHPISAPTLARVNSTAQVWKIVWRPSLGDSGDKMTFLSSTSATISVNPRLLSEVLAPPLSNLRMWDVPKSQSLCVVSHKVKLKPELPLRRLSRSMKPENFEIKASVTREAVMSGKGQGSFRGVS